MSDESALDLRPDQKADDWEDITGESLTSLKSGEGYSLELRSGEVAALIEGLEARKELYEKFGISPGQHDYLAGAGDLVDGVTWPPGWVEDSGPAEYLISAD
ncbi:MAG TPA: hypothetical protein VNP96_11750 [Solirubrobacterales bacterium]|nr:hypothetical protein [Solirubrobacterales bacterium]